MSRGDADEVLDDHLDVVAVLEGGAVVVRRHHRKLDQRRVQRVRRRVGTPYWAWKGKCDVHGTGCQVATTRPNRFYSRVCRLFSGVPLVVGQSRGTS